MTDKQENVVDFNGITTLNADPARVLENVMNAGLQDVVAIGYDGDGDFYFASSIAGGPDVLWLLALAQSYLFTAGSGGND